MPRVRLQAADIERLGAAQRILLSPLSHDDPREWRLQANHAVRRLVGADHSVFSVPSGASLALFTDDTDPAFPGQFLGYFAGMVAGEFRFRDPALQSAERTRRAVGPAAFHEFELASRDAIRRSVALQEIFRPAGMTSQIGISVSQPVADATQFFGFEGANAQRRSERGLELLRLLVPAFEAGARVHRRWHARGAAFADALDRTGQAAAVYSVRGARLHQTGHLREILAAGPGSDALQAAMDDLARMVGSHGRGESGPGATPIRPGVQVRCGGASYGLLASCLDACLLGMEAVLVLVSRHGAVLPTAAELAARSALSPREAETALLLARGLTDAAIAERLSIRPNTARRYCERVLGKLGIHSRAAVAITLLDMSNDGAGT